MANKKPTRIPPLGYKLPSGITDGPWCVWCPACVTVVAENCAGDVIMGWNPNRECATCDKRRTVEV